jgi:hypothetical protein
MKIDVFRPPDFGKEQFEAGEVRVGRRLGSDGRPQAPGPTGG